MFQSMFRTTISADNKRVALEKSDFGKSAAEFDETLVGTFVETTIWNGVLGDRIDIVFGPKGSGKSAIAVLLGDRRRELRKDGIVIVDAESPDTADPIFRALNDLPSLSEEQLASMWKLYFVTLLGMTLRALALRDHDAHTVIDALEQAGLLPQEAAPPLERLLQRVLAYISPNAFADAHIGIPGTPLHIGGGVEILLHEPAPHHHAKPDVQVVSLRELLIASGRALDRAKLKVWFVLDRLDVAFSNDSKLEAQALRALFHTWLSLSPREYRLKLKIFLRPDIWARIAGELAATHERFSQASAIQGEHIIWDTPTLSSLLARRLCFQDSIRNLYRVNPRRMAGSADEQARFYARIFPPITAFDEHLPPIQGDGNDQTPKTTFHWLLNALRDGTGQVAPRSLVLLLIYARTAQVRRLHAGAATLPDQQLFEPESLQEALNEVSRFQLFQTLYAEYPDLYTPVEQLRGGPDRFSSAADLASRWNTSPDGTERTIALLTHLGVFEPLGIGTGSEGWRVPPLYARALALRVIA